VSVTADVNSAPLVRAIARSAYERGALFVDPFFSDGAVKRTRLEHADPETLAFVPPWYGERFLALGERRSARISIQPNPEPGVLDGVDPALAGRDGLPFVSEILKVIDDRSTNWTVVPYPTQAWAEITYSGLDPAEALKRLEADIVHVARLDEPDPNAAWQQRGDELEAAAERLNERRFDAIHFEGPGTDLTIGLLPASHWSGARTTTEAGIPHFANVPTEEVWTAPDPTRADGVVRSTKPLDVEGALIRNLVVKFEGGRAVGIDAGENAEALRERVAVDDGAARLGELALVDREGRIGRRNTVFMNTLLDENAASHIALGNAYASSARDEDRERLNQSEIHIDFMIGGDDVAVTGVTADGARIPVLRDGTWQL
jgi:aminopeptidase